MRKFKQFGCRRLQPSSSKELQVKLNQYFEISMSFYFDERETLFIKVAEFFTVNVSFVFGCKYAQFRITESLLCCIIVEAFRADYHSKHWLKFLMKPTKMGENAIYFIVVAKWFYVISVSCYPWRHWAVKYDQLLAVIHLILDRQYQRYFMRGVTENHIL